MLAQVLSGHGRVANDLYAPFDADYAKALPQRHQDIDQAKALLKAAGMEDLTVDLHTTDGAAGMVDSANVFASQAKAAGVTINVKERPELLRRPVPQAAVLGRLLGHAQLPGAVRARHAARERIQRDPLAAQRASNVSLYKQAKAAPTPEKRRELTTEMQKIEYNTGGYIIPFFNNLVDAYSPKVAGFVPSKGTLNLDTFGHGYRTIWFA